MRIVAGNSKGRKLIVPKGRSVRPTTDRVREALFSSLGTLVSDARVLDLFAGTGALGLEALSRGAASVVFVERDAKVRAVLERNIHALDFEVNSRLISGDSRSALKILAREGAVFDLVFLDPPYSEALLPATLEGLEKGSLLVASSRIIAEHARGDIPLLPNSLRLTTTRRYGDTELSVIEKAG